MPPDERWLKLHRQRFPDLPFDCGNRSDPGIIYSEDLRDWSDKATTPDQRRIEHYIDRFDLRDKRILHIGIGNSGLAGRFHGRVAEIVGTTIDQPEIDVARSLALPNYSFVLHNKYSGDRDRVPGKFDFIIDNNPTSPCCCFRHLADLVEFYAARLAEGGQIVTDREGLGWIPDNSNRRWSFNFDDLASVGAAVGFRAFRANRNVYVLSRSEPPLPSWPSLSRHWLRRAAMMPAQVARRASRLIKRPIKWALRSAATRTS